MAGQAVQEFDEAALRDLLREFFDVAEEDLDPAATLDDLGLDSLGLMEMVVALEDRTGAELVGEMEALSPSSTLAEATEFIRSAMPNGSC